MKRTKRYGGFRIGDRVEHKEYGKGVVDGFFNGGIFVWFDKFVMKGDYFGSTIAPNQLINLTRIEEEQEEILELPPISEETAKELEERFTKFCGKHNITPPKANFNPAKEIDELKAIRGFVDEALRQTEIFLSPLTPCVNPLPSPYTRDVYSTTKDYD